MDYRIDQPNTAWENMTLEEKNHQLYLNEKELLDTFLQHGAITQAQHDKSLHDLQKKMGEKD
jgi:hypothetical protein